MSNAGKTVRYTLDNTGLAEPAIAIVGCGGTGGVVADGICRLLGDRKATLVLVDPDRVEEHNLRRQAFFEADLGRFKSQALAERLSVNYGREIAYSVYPYSRSIHDPVFGSRWNRGGAGIVIGCVDNPAARRSIAEAVNTEWWVDAGNSENSGQVVVGNTIRGEDLKKSFYEDAGVCTRLPLPTVQVPELLLPIPESAPDQPAHGTPDPVDCAQAVEAGDQSPVVNQWMAALVVQFVSRLMAGTLEWMGAYVDLDLGTLRPVEASPKVVARMTGLTQKALVNENGPRGRQPCPNCGRVH